MADQNYLKNIAIVGVRPTYLLHFHLVTNQPN